MLKQMQGVEYVLAHAGDNGFFLIRKQYRHSPQQETLLAFYYIINGVVFQAPDLSSVFQSRIRTLIHHLDDSFTAASSSVSFRPSDQHQWNFQDEGPTSDENLLYKFKADPFDSQRKDSTREKLRHFRVGQEIEALDRKFPLPKDANPKAGKQAKNNDKQAAVAEQLR
eukprot:m.174606 g.174606  ORF g.174606 m.174606 type:complete len:168 (-) comp25280_c0_seq3:98-601(-)